MFFKIICFNSYFILSNLYDINEFLDRKKKGQIRRPKKGRRGEERRGHLDKQREGKGKYNCISGS